MKAPVAHASRGNAFTLVELLVATAITSLLLLGMTGVFDQANKAWRLAARRADAEREVRAALSQIERDLTGIVVSARLPIYLNVIDNNRVNIPNPFRANLTTLVGNSGVDWADVSLVMFFASTQPSRSGQAGDVAGIGYFIAWDQNSNGTNGAWNLYRRYQPPTDLFGALQTRARLPTLQLASAGPYNANSVPAPELLAANVMNFWVSPVVFRTNGLPATLPTNASAGVDLGQLGTGAWITNRPSYFQLELTAYGSEQVRAFTGPSRESRKAQWANTSNIARYGRTYVWRVDP